MLKAEGKINELITGVTERAGGDCDTLGMAWQYRWGGGL
jgi:hypothetical protein